MDGTYKIVSNLGEYKAIITLLVYNKANNAFLQGCYSLITEEMKKLFKNI